MSGERTNPLDANRPLGKGPQIEEDLRCDIVVVGAGIRRAFGSLRTTATPNVSTNSGSKADWSLNQKIYGPDVQSGRASGLCECRM